MIKINHKGNFDKTNRFFKGIKSRNYIKVLNKYGEVGVSALSSATPIDSSETSKSWSYKITQNKGGVAIVWENSHIVNGVPIAIIIQYGHATRNGGYVQGRDYINPALRPIFDKIANDVWKEVTKL